MNQIYKILFIAFFVCVDASADQTKECKLIQRKLSGDGNINILCSSIYKECISDEFNRLDLVKIDKNQCLKELGDCQMAGQLSGEDLNRAIVKYKNKCER